MSVKITSRKYKNKYSTNDIGWFLGNTGDLQQVVIEAEFGVFKWFSNSSPLQFTEKGTVLTMLDGENWENLGFEVGRTILMQFSLTEYESTGAIKTGTPRTVTNASTIALIEGNKLTLSTQYSLQQDINIPYRSATMKIDEVIIGTNKQPEGCDIIYGHIENANAATGDLKSFIDGTLTRISCEGMNIKNISLFPVSAKLLGKQSGMSIISASWKYKGVASSSGKNQITIFKYEFTINYIISSFYEELKNLEDNKAPSVLFDANSLTDNFKLIIFPKINNPNIKIESDIKKTAILGNSGWFGENFNGLPNNFKVESLEYSHKGEKVEKLSHGNEINVKAVISGVKNLTNGISKFGIGFLWAPENEAYYKGKLTPYHKNLMINIGGDALSGAFSLSTTKDTTTYLGHTTVADRTMNVKDVHFYKDGNNLVYEALWVPTTAFKDFVETLEENDRNYLLWISVADSTLVDNLSDRVALKIDYNKFELYSAQIGQWQGMNIGLYEHHQDGQTVETNCSPNYKLEDDLLARVDFTLDITKDIPTELSYAIEAERESDGLKNELDRYNIDLTNYSNDITGTPQWDYDQIRGYKLGDGNNKNFVKLKRNTAKDVDDGKTKGYVGFYGFKIRWEDWIEKLGLSTDFYNATRKHKGFNENWLNYVKQNGWKVNFTVYLTSTASGSIVTYTNSISFGFDTYNQNTGITKTWNYLREIGKTPINIGTDIKTGYPAGVILSNELTRVEVLYVRSSGTWASLNEVYGTICLEVEDGAGQFEFRQLSTLWDSEEDNPLRSPDAGVKKCKIQLINSTTIKLSCLVSPTFLKKAKRYKLTSRLGCK